MNTWYVDYEKDQKNNISKINLKKKAQFIIKTPK